MHLYSCKTMIVPRHIIFILPFVSIVLYQLRTDAWTISQTARRRLCRTGTFASNSDANNYSDDLLNCTNSPPVQGITLKIAVDARGAAADLGAKIQERFTCDASLDMVHRLRASCQAVLVGKGTVQADDPSLLVRRNVNFAQQPLRVVLDPSLSLLNPSSPTYQLFQDGYKTVVFYTTTGTPDTSRVSDGVLFRRVPHTADGNLSLVAVLHILSDEFQVRHLMVEGGPYTAQQFLKQQLVDRCIHVQAPIQFTDQPLDAGMTDELLQDTAGLVYLGSANLGIDTVTYWSRPRQPWPCLRLEDWP